MNHEAGILELEKILPYKELGRSSFREPAAFNSEWLVTNGIGGYASASLSGALTRRYHGLLIAALRPPLQRTLLLAKLDETASYLAHSYPLFSNIWQNQKIDPRGHYFIEKFYLSGSIPNWEYRLGDAVLRKSIWMKPGANTTYVTYTLIRASAALQLSIKAIVNFRGHHNTAQRSREKIAVHIGPGLIQLDSGRGTGFKVYTSQGENRIVQQWIRDYYYPIEARRGLDALDDHLHAANIQFSLEPGQQAHIIATTEQEAPLSPPEALADRMHYEIDLLNKANKLWHFPPVKPHDHDRSNQLKHLCIAADQFIVSRPVPGEPDGQSVIAGYPWFSDWGRDTMISLPGLALATGRPELARIIIRTFAHFIDQGMLPNRFPSAHEKPEYNTVDATLWYFYAIHSYLKITQDIALLEEIYPRLVDIVDWHISGTRYKIKVDPADQLLYAGEAGVQLTWMDAKVDDWVVTPRIGKPVEINALWYNANQFMHNFANQLNKPGQRYAEYAQSIAHNFQKFWLPDEGYLYDVIEGPEGHDASFRPNQLFAISLPHSPLSTDQQQSVVRLCAQKLYSGMGLRSLAFDDPDYIGSYGGNQKQRDAAYHQGTVWGWLIGPFVNAWRQAYNDRIGAIALLSPIFQQLDDHCIGNLSEIFEGQPPHEPRGCFAQAWSVAEVLWSWYQLN